MSDGIFDLGGDPSFEKMLAPVRPVLDRIVQDMKSVGRFSTEDIMQMTWLSCNGLITAYNRTVLQNGEQEMLELSGACLLTAANAIWMSFVMMNTVKALATAHAGDVQTGSVH